MAGSSIDTHHLASQQRDCLSLGVFGTVLGFVWYYEGVKALVRRTAVFNNLVPVFGVALSAVMLHEAILISMVIGGSLVMLGVTITNRSLTSN